MPKSLEHERRSPGQCVLEDHAKNNCYTTFDTEVIKCQSNMANAPKGIGLA